MQGIQIGMTILMLALSSAQAEAQSGPSAQTTTETTLYSKKSVGSAGLMTLPSGQQFIIIQPKSVFIGKGVTIGKGVLIEGKPWHQVQLPDGTTGFLTGSVICSPTISIAGTSGICP